MQCLIPLFFLLNQFIFIHCAVLPPRSLYRRNTKQNIGIIAGQKGRSENSDFFCDASQTAAIENAIGWMNRYAASSYNYLLESNSKTSAGFIGWFGDGNTDKASSIRDYIYEPIYDLGSEAKYYVSSLEEVDQTVVIGCGTLHNSPICRRPGVAAAAQAADNTIVVCPAAFTNNGYYASDAAEYAAQTLWRDSRTLMSTAGLTLLHEMTHLPGVVGDFRYWAGNNRADDHVYEPSNCIKLPDDQTITNAQNYMLFALDARANSEYAKKQVDMNADSTWNFAIQWLRAGAGGRRETP
ncbi:hypothetical protein CSHISOI_11588 [Colletotrichum shisoi]|uniref:Lysine-specific metallo-endopeptidase domain-containing protein n=1 Tax=Colletotrichum shisoi TaxID=2078593 RepID=A0A5Q4BA87_9PEZI|nr:hypothetical protein CSHISOI_11588 [Colletotrichum shisoi]